MTETRSDLPPSVPDIRAALDDVTQSEALGPNSRATAILRYVVEQELAGRGGLLKAYPIGIDVLGRSADFDPSSDSIVRVEVMRLRSALARYYEGEGARDSIIIDLPKGSYRPTFRQVAGPPGKPEAPALQGKNLSPRLATLLALIGILLAIIAYQGWTIVRGTPPDIARSAISVLVRDHRASAQDSAATERANSLLQQLRISLSRNNSLSVFTPDTLATAERRRPNGHDFIVDGSVENFGSDSRFSVELLNGRTNTLVWARTYSLDRQNLGSGQDAIVNQVTREIYPRIFGASKEALEGRDPEKLTAYQLFVSSTWVPGFARSTLTWEKERLEMARLAVRKDRDFGPAYSVMADKLIYLASVDPPSNTPAALDEAAASARRAKELAPANIDALFNVAVYHWHAGEIDEAVRVLRRIVDLDPNHGFARTMGAMFPYTCVPAPDDVLEKAIAFDDSLGPDNPIRWVTLTWLGILHLNRDELTMALRAEQRAAQIFQTPDTVMRHAVILNALGRSDEAINLVDRQRTNWPNIDAGHFSDVTMIRRCREFADASTLIAKYADLTAVIRSRGFSSGGN